MKYLIIFFLVINTLNCKELILPINSEINYNIQKALLGKKLFFDKRLSKDNTISCASCHDISNGGADNKDFSIGINNRKGNVNSPTVLNSKYNFTQFWNGRARDLKEQINGPVHNPMEMGSTLDKIIDKISTDNYYKKQFELIYKQGLTKKSLVDAIAEFENALITPDSRFDKYLKGDKKALNKDEIKGYNLFKQNGCISCHNGVNIGGNLFQKMGILKEYKSKIDNLGRYNITKDEEDKNYFKVPTLRNIDKTAPYFHDASAKTLHDAVSVMMEYQLGIEPNEDEVNKIVKFLKTLDGQTPKIMDEK
ncbi:cytochrome B6 [Malaciobacter molluscorum LMG 25693]|uniref:Cytochrome B6 n=1 Tax=Malaciobacter molluscorum LMG 25693 TaxID=870501 RepID=A0A2G1DH94_9BACT|nr:cytochrome-c peroxidase [Malaciobacter molluscorum]AXX91071.1 cytochrome c peroxidase [Malaciobacter molluscorum LMG 25693]PHO17855.1 cytochrome B6 [Malaciobacter molluscorum LMG 25693]